MTATDWCVWIGYEIVVAVVVYAKSVYWFCHPSRVAQGGALQRVIERFGTPSVNPIFLRARRMQTSLQSWLTVFMLAFFAAVGLSQWLRTGTLATLIAFGLASGIILSAAVNAAGEVGLRVGQEMPDTETQTSKDESPGSPTPAT